MPAIRILAIEDEELHADMLRLCLDQPGYELIAILADATDVFPVIRATKPDVILMDIDLNSDINGIELTAAINETADIPIIYLTSHRDQETFRQASNTLPESYLTKPYDAFQLQSAIELAVLKHRQQVSALKKTAATATADWLYINDGEGLSRINFSDILFLQAFDKYCHIYTADKKHLMNATLKSVSAHLPSERFIQVHRSYVINLACVEKLLPAENAVRISDKLIPVSRTYKHLVFSHFNMV
ncbi:MAG: LytTR family transcriptional regulator DNA-binding domain-containing protein [Bacteroidota bacterium]